MRDNFFTNNATIVAEIYENAVNNTVIEEMNAHQKVYNNLTTMLEECYFIGASKFGNNFIA